MATDGISRTTTSHTSAAAGLTAAGTGGTTLDRGIAANLATSRAINAYMEAMSEDLRQANDTAKSLGDLQVFMSEKIKGTFKSSTDLDARLDLQEDFKNA